MVAAQIERLESDLREIRDFEKELKSEGNSNLSAKVSSKRQYLQQYLEEVTT